MSHLHLVALIVRDYDAAIRFFVDVLDFELVEDSPSSTNDGRPKRWVVVRPRGGTTGLLLARADGAHQLSAAGQQFAGRVGLFLQVDEFDATYQRLVAAGVEFVTAPRVEACGQVAVFLDLEGNRWDLLGLNAVPAREQGGMTSLLDAFAEAWNRHDLDALMSMMTSDCVFEASGGNAVDGERYQGQAAVRAAFADVFEQFPDAHWAHARHFIAGNRGVSEWTFSGTRKGGQRVEVIGCDVFTFQDGRIAIKNSFRKNRPPIG